MSRSFFASDAEYIDFLEQRCRTLVVANNGIKSMLGEKNARIVELSNDASKERKKRVKAQRHIARLKQELSQKDEKIVFPKEYTFSVDLDAKGDGGQTVMLKGLVSDD